MGSFPTANLFAEFQQLRNEVQIGRLSEKVGDRSKSGVVAYLLKPRLRQARGIRTVLLIGSTKQNGFTVSDPFTRDQHALGAFALRLERQLVRPVHFLLSRVRQLHQDFDIRSVACVKAAELPDAAALLQRSLQAASVRLSNRS